VNFTVIRPLIF